MNKPSFHYGALGPSIHTILCRVSLVHVSLYYLSVGNSDLI